MMKCPKCESLVEDDSTSCWNCHVDFKAPDPNAAPRVSAPAYVPEARRRPDGTVLLGIGTALLVLAGLLLLVSMTGGSSDPYDEAPALIGRGLTLFAAAGLFQLGLVLTLAGTIVRAIWFLPGDEEKVPPTG